MTKALPKLGRLNRPPLASIGITVLLVVFAWCILALGVGHDSYSVSSLLLVATLVLPLAVLVLGVEPARSFMLWLVPLVVGLLCFYVAWPKFDIADPLYPRPEVLPQVVRTLFQRWVHDAQLRWIGLVLMACSAFLVAGFVRLREECAPSKVGSATLGFGFAVVTLVLAQVAVNAVALVLLAGLAFLYLIADVQGRHVGSLRKPTSAGGKPITLRSNVAQLAALVLACFAEAGAEQRRVFEALASTEDSLSDHRRHLTDALGHTSDHVILLAFLLPNALALVIVAFRNASELRATVVNSKSWLALTAATPVLAVGASLSGYHSALGVLQNGIGELRDRMGDIQFEIVQDPPAPGPRAAPLFIDQHGLHTNHLALLTSHELSAPDCEQRFATATKRLKRAPDLLAAKGAVPFQVLLCWPALFKKQGSLRITADPVDTKASVSAPWRDALTPLHRKTRTLRFISSETTAGRIALARGIKRLERYPGLLGGSNIVIFDAPPNWPPQPAPESIHDLEKLIHVAKNVWTLYCEGRTPGAVVTVKNSVRVQDVPNCIDDADRQWGEYNRIGIVLDRDAPLQALAQSPAHAVFLLDPMQGGPGRLGTVRFSDIVGSDPRLTEEVTQRFRSLTRPIQYCYNDALDESPDLKGVAELRVQASPSGRFTASSILAAAPLKEMWIRCTERLLDRQPIPSSAVDARVTFEVQ